MDFVVTSIQELLSAKRMQGQIPIPTGRTRGGDFCYSDVEFEAMLEDVKAFKNHGADGIVFGILNPDGTIDKERSERVIEAARPLPVTFHRAFDMSKDLFQSLEDLIDLGVDRILTSGGEPTVMEGILSSFKKKGCASLTAP